MNWLFYYSRGVKQGDPLSHLLFCMAQEVLSRGLSQLVENKQLEPIKGTRDKRISSHSLYADNDMLFYTDSFTKIQVLTAFFDMHKP